MTPFFPSRPPGPRLPRTIPLALQPLESRDAPAAFTPGNLLVYRVGTGSALTNKGTAVFLDEYATAAGQSAPVQSLALPTAVSGANKRLVASGIGTAEGLMTRSADGKYLVLAGYDAAVGDAAVATNNHAKTVARVDAAGTVDTTTTFTDGYTGGSSAIRSVASLDGGGFWTAGSGTANGGARYIAYGAASSVQLNSAANNTRQIAVFTNQLYQSAFSTPPLLGTVGSGTPMTAGQTIAALPGFPTSGSPFGFFFADLTAGVAGLDTLYVASDDAAALSKYSLVSGAWTASGVVGTTTDHYRGLTASVAGTTVTLYAVRDGKELVTLTDASGYNGALAGTPAVVATAANNTGFRGVAFAPLAAGAPNAAPTLNDITAPAPVNEDAGEQTVTVSGVTTGGEAWQTAAVTATSENTALLAAVSVVAGGDGTTRDVKYTPVPDASGTAVITVTVTDNGGTANGGVDTVSKTFTVTVNPVNDAPRNHVPAPQTTKEDTPLVFSTANGNAVTVSDVDAGTGTATVILTATNGLLDLGSTADLSVSNNHTALVTLAGQLAAVNAGLSGLTFTPTVDYFGPASIRLQTDDGGNAGAGGPLTADDIFAVTVSPVNDAPTLIDIADPPAIAEDAGEQTLTITGLAPGPANESGQKLASITASSDNPALTGIIAVSGSGTTRFLKYTPASNASGTAMITVRIEDDGGTADGGVNAVEKSFTVTVNPVNDAPVNGLPSTFAALEDTQLALVGITVTDVDAGAADVHVTFSVTSGTLTLLDDVPARVNAANITGQDTAALTVTAPLSKIAATLTANGLLFHPAAEMSGPVTLTMTADDFSLADSDTATITVTAINDAPTLNDIPTVNPIDEDAGQQSVTITGLSAGPANEVGQQFTVTVTSDNMALIGAITFAETGASRQLLFTPAANANGSAVITVRVEDNGGTDHGAVNFVEKTFAVMVNPVNDPPTLADIPDPTPVDEDAGEQSVALTGITGGPNEVGQPITITATSGNAALLSAVTITGSGSSRTLKYTPVANANGTAVVTVRVQDNGTGANFTEKTFTVTVNAVNDPPTLNAITNPAAIAEDAGEQTRTVSGILAGPADEAGQSVTVTATSSNPALIGAVVVTGDGATRDLSYSPAADANGTAVITVRVQDNGTGTNFTEKTFTVTVAAVNDPPSFTKGVDQITDEDSGSQTVAGWAVNRSAGPADEVGQTLTFHVTTDNDALFSTPPAVAPDGTLTYTPAPDANGTATVAVQLTDSGGGANASAAQTFAIRVTAVNDAPTLADIPNPAAVAEDAGEQAVPLIGITAGPADEVGQAITVMVTSNNPSLIASVDVTGDGPTRQVTYTPAPNANGAAVITVRVRDDGDGNNVVEKMFAVNVTPVNDPPTLAAIADPPMIDEDAAEQTVTLTGLSAGPPDEAGQPLNVTATSGNRDLIAAVSVSGGGTTRDLKFTPAPDASGTAVITVRVDDGGPGSHVVEKTFAVTVTAVNDAPRATDGTLSATEDTAATGALSATDIDGGALTYSIVEQPMHGIVSLTGAASGAYTYAPEPNYNGPDRFSFRANDGAANSNVATVVVSVAAVNDKPTIDTAFGVVIDRLPAKTADPAGASVSALLAHAADADADPLGVAVTAAAASPATGRWQHRLDASAAWADITGVSVGLPLLLPATAQVRFIPAAKFTGFAPLVYKAWDGSAFSTAIETAWVAVGRTTPAIDAAGHPLFTPVLKDAVNPAGDMVKKLLGSLATDPDKKDKLGMAVTSADSANGTWEFKTGRAWASIADVSESSALLLGPATRVRFRPAAGYFGPATLTYRAWDGRVGVTGERAAAVGPAFSAEDETAVVNVVARPALDTTTAHVLAGPKLVSNLLAGAVTDVLPGTTLGIAVTGFTGKGAWNYQLPNGPLTRVPKVSAAKVLLLPADAVLSFAGTLGVATLRYRVWNATALPRAAGSFGNVSNTAFSAASETLSVLAGPNAPPTIPAAPFTLGTLAEDPTSNPGVSVKQVAKAAGGADPDKNPVGVAVTGMTGAGMWEYTLNHGKTWQSVGSVTPINALLLSPTAKLRFAPTTNQSGPAALTIKAWDGTFATSGDYADPASLSAFSPDSAVGTLTVTAVNDPPILDASKVKYLPNIAAGTSISASVASLVTAAADAEPGALGIAVTAVTGRGTWEFSPDGVSAFVPLPKLPAVLPASAAVHFVADDGFAGVASLTYKAADGDGGLSTATETLTVAVGNQAPSLSGPGTLTDILEDPKKNAGDTVAALLKETVHDSAVGAPGVAVTAAAGPGAWQFSLDNGKSWADVGAVNGSSALLLSSKSKVRFAPALNQSGTATLTYTAWDGTVGTAGERFNLSAPGQSAFGGNQTATVTVTPVADAPMLNTTGTPTLAAGQVGALISAFLNGTVTDPEGGVFGIAVIGVSGKGTWEFSLAGPAAFQPLGAVSKRAPRLLPASTLLRFLPAAGFIGTATLTYKAWNTTPADGAPFSVASEILSVVVGDLPPTLIDL